MENCIHLKDGTKIPLSDETAGNLKKQFGKPEIRHGDYGLCLKHGKRCGFVYDASSHTPSFFLIPLARRDGYIGLYGEVDEIISIDGNFDDIKAKKDEGEDLRRWQSAFAAGEDNPRHRSITIDCKKRNTIWLGTTGNSAYYTLDQAVEIHQKLGQIIATAEKDKAKDC